MQEETFLNQNDLEDRPLSRNCCSDGDQTCSFGGNI